MALLSTLPPINPRLNGGPAIMPDFYHRGGGASKPQCNAICSAFVAYISLLLQGSVTNWGCAPHRTWDGWIKVSDCVAYFLWQMWHAAQPLHRTRFQLIYILRPPIPEVNDDVGAVCKFNDAGKAKPDSLLMQICLCRAESKYKISFSWKCLLALTGTFFNTMTFVCNISASGKPLGHCICWKIGSGQLWQFLLWLSSKGSLTSSKIWGLFSFRNKLKTWRWCLHRSKLVSKNSF